MSGSSLFLCCAVPCRAVPWALAALLLQLEFKMLFPAEILCCRVDQMVETAVGLGAPIWEMGCSIHVHGSVSISYASLWSKCCWEPAPLVGPDSTTVASPPSPGLPGTALGLGCWRAVVFPGTVVLSSEPTIFLSL